MGNVHDRQSWILNSPAAFHDGLQRADLWIAVRMGLLSIDEARVVEHVPGRPVDPWRYVIKEVPHRSASVLFVGQEVLERLRWDILDGSVAPDEKLRFAMLQSRYRVGVGTVREALSSLVSEGLVNVDAGRGFRVSPVSRADLLDISELRVDFEKRAFGDAIRHGDDAWELGIISAFHLLDKLESRPLKERLKDVSYWTKVHRDFHDALVSACCSRWLLQFRSTLFHQADRYRLLSQRHRPPTTNRKGEHRAMMELALKRDEAAACKLAEQHIRSTVDEVLRYAPQFATSRKSSQTV